MSHGRALRESPGDASVVQRLGGAYDERLHDDGGDELLVPDVGDTFHSVFVSDDLAGLDGGVEQAAEPIDPGDRLPAAAARRQVNWGSLVWNQPESRRSAQRESVIHRL